VEGPRQELLKMARIALPRASDMKRLASVVAFQPYGERPIYSVEGVGKYF
jgi:hypothetical protein